MCPKLYGMNVYKLQLLFSSLERSEQEVDGNMVDKVGNKAEASLRLLPSVQAA